ncbi:hypothetical protein CAL7716_059830 [Calothrix sp. PCC 7716]|nr:hypothetical protein CAL7716_059830 [Calothrix sp. PCC 7716]
MKKKKQKQENFSHEYNDPLVFEHNGELTTEALEQLILLHKQGYIKGGYSLIIYGANQFRPADTFAEIENFKANSTARTTGLQQLSCTCKLRGLHCNNKYSNLQSRELYS